MNLLEYIKMSYLRPNKQVLKGLGASDDLITYLIETPGNTNIVIANQLIGSNNETDEGLVIINGIPETLYSSAGDYTSIGFLFESEPTTLENIKVGTTFTVEINNQSYDFTIAVVNTESGNRNYASSITEVVPYFKLADTIEGFACEMSVEGDIRPITHFKVIQTSDYEESEMDNLIILDDTVTFETYVEGVYKASINTSFTFTDSADAPQFLIVEVDEQTIVLPKTESVYAMYGEFESFANYPLLVMIDEDGRGETYSDTFIGEQHVKFTLANEEPTSELESGK